MLTFTIALENASTAPVRLYFVLLPTTLTHFSPHHRLLFGVVKRKHTFFRKNCVFSPLGKLQIFPTTNSGFLPEVCLPFVV